MPEILHKLTQNQDEIDHVVFGVTTGEYLDAGKVRNFIARVRPG